MERRKPLERKTRLRADPAKTREWQDRSRRALPQESERTKAEKPQRRAAVAVARARDGDRCRLLGVPGHECFGPLTPHHILKSSQGGADTAENILTICAGGNTWVEDDPDAAHALGLVQRRSDTIADCWERMWRSRIVTYGPTGGPPVHNATPT